MLLARLEVRLSNDSDRTCGGGGGVGRHGLACLETILSRDIQGRVPAAATSSSLSARRSYTFSLHTWKKESEMTWESVPPGVPWQGVVRERGEGEG